MPRLPSLLLALLLASTHASAVEVGALLAAVSDNTPAPNALRADVVVARGDTKANAVLLAWRDILYFETADGFRTLVRPHKAVIVQDGHPVRAALRTQVAGTDILSKNLPFAGVPLRFPQIHGWAGVVVVGGEPAAPSLYVLVVRPIDPERRSSASPSTTRMTSRPCSRGAVTPSFTKVKATGGGRGR